MTPPSHPLAVQVMWLLDDCDEENGAFYFIPGTHRAARRPPSMGDSGEGDSSGALPPNARQVLGGAGSVVLANGALWHGAAPNYSARPRVALLYEYVPRFVRPGMRFPRSVLDVLHTGDAHVSVAAEEGGDKGHEGTDAQEARRLHRELSALLDLERDADAVTLQAPGGERSFVPQPCTDVAAAALAFCRGGGGGGGGGGEGSVPTADDAACARRVEHEAVESLLRGGHIAHPSHAAVRGAAAPRRREDATAAAGGESTASAHRFHDGATAHVELRVGEGGARSVLMPTVGFGTGGAGVNGSMHDSVLDALRSGYRAFDCAESYANQQEVGAALELAMSPVSGGGMGVPREALFITSKVWPTNFAPEHVLASLRLTLRHLRLQQLDLLLLHWPVPLLHTGSVDGPSRGVAFPVRADGTLVFRGEDPHATGAGVAAVAGGAVPQRPRGTLLETWRALERAMDEGLVRAIGVSNMGAAALHELLAAARIPPALNQVELHPQLQQRALLRYCATRGVHVQAHTPLGGHSSAATFGDGVQPPLREPTVARIAAARGVSPAQVLLRWGLQRGASVVPYSSHPARVRQNAPTQLFSFALSRAEIEALDTLERGRRYMAPELFKFLWA